MEVSFTKSITFDELCGDIIPASSSTLAKSPERLEKGYSPFFAEKANGSHFTDIDGNDWLDCEMAMGTVVWGHNHPQINQAMINQIEKGVNFSIPSTLEYELASILLNRFPLFKAAKFCKNGADAVYAAVRSSRFYSQKTKVLSCEYHGWLDWCSPGYYHCEPSTLGIPNAFEEEHISSTKNALEIKQHIEKNAHNLACIVLCPANYKVDDLREILTLCRANDVYTIFDEVTSGIRYAYGGVTMLHKLEPDFLCLSKGLTNGLPLAVVLGSKDKILCMKNLKISNAHSGENLALAAAIQCEHMMETHAENWPLWKHDTEKIMHEIDLYLKEHCSELILEGSPACFSVVTQGVAFQEDPFRKYLLKYMSNQHIFTKGYFIFSVAHTTEEIEQVGTAIINCIKSYTQCNENLTVPMD